MRSASCPPRTLPSRPPGLAAAPELGGGTLTYGYRRPSRHACPRAGLGLRLVPEAVIAQTLILAGARHRQTVEALASRLPKAEAEYTEDDDGLVTSDPRFAGYVSDFVLSSTIAVRSARKRRALPSRLDGLADRRILPAQAG
jgi:hypothetical protein